MSMLAEPRRKQRVINLRAKNSAWSNDTNKFGQRMLEKMGWSSGKGLGAKENGIVEHVVARYKNDEKGLGYEDKNDQWTKHDNDFNSLLANLSNTDGNTDVLHSGISLEKKSKKSKARIHYHKFTRGKDLSRYSEKDLANIFGKKSFKETEIEEPVTDDVKTSEQVFTEKGNMDDYFKSKLASLKSKFLNTEKNIDHAAISDYGFQGFSNTGNIDSDSTKNGFGSQSFSFYSTQNNDNVPEKSNSIENIEVGISKSKKKKKSKNEDQITNNTEESVVCNREELVSEINGETDTITKPPKKKKKSKKKSLDVSENEAEICTNVNKKEKKKSKKDKVEDVQEHMSIEDYVPKKKKKRKN